MTMASPNHNSGSGVLEPAREVVQPESSGEVPGSGMASQRPVPTLHTVPVEQSLVVVQLLRHASSRQTNGAQLLAVPFTSTSESPSDEQVPARVMHAPFEQTLPVAQSPDVAHVVRHAEVVGSQAYAPQGAVAGA
jgi:hypothetical protein